MHGNLFLTLVGVFSFYLAFSGYRALYRKDAYKTHRVAFIDWFFAILNSVFSFALIVYGIMILPGAFGIISIVFGFLGTALGVRDIVSFLRPPASKTHWFFSHMSGMIAAYIAAMSAFSAVNLTYDWMPTVVQWLWPTIIGVPLMNLWMKKYREKFNKGRSIRQEVVVSIKADAVE